MANYYYYFSRSSSLNPYAPEFFPSPKYYSIQTNFQFSPQPAAPTFIISSQHAFSPSLSPTSPACFYFSGPKATSPELDLHARPLPHNFFYSLPHLSPEPVSTKSSRIMHEKKARNRGGGGGNSIDFNRPPRQKKQDCNMNSRIVWKIKGGEEVRFPGVKDSQNIDKFSRVVEYKAQKKRGMKFEVLEVHEDENKTTVMIRNIPSKYTRGMVLDFLDKYCLKVNQRVIQSSNSPQAPDEEERYLTAYDFFYMPMDFKTGMNKSYAFVNFSDSRAVWNFSRDCFMKDWEYFQSSKKMEIALAKYQGKDQLIERFGRTAFACENDEYLPVCFDPPRDGSNNGELETVNVGKRIPNKTTYQKY